MSDQHDQETAVHETQQETAIHEAEPGREAQPAGFAPPESEEAAQTGDEARPEQQQETEPQPASHEQTKVYFSREEAQEEPAPTPPPPRDEPSAPESPAEADRMAAEERQQDSFARKPHLYVAGAFVGSFALAKVLKALTGGGDDE